LYRKGISPRCNLINFIKIKRIHKIDLLGAEDISPIIPSKEMLLWLDVHRNNRTYRVNVHLTNNRKYRY
jgi:hypothetical protein